MSKAIFSCVVYCIRRYISFIGVKGELLCLLHIATIVILRNYLFSAVLQIPKSNKNMFDECPWPFTLFHDPKKFAKDGLTWTVLLWAGLCQVYSLIMKARAAGSLPSKIMFV
jgi:hypothetical protein